MPISDVNDNSKMQHTAFMLISSICYQHIILRYIFFNKCTEAHFSCEYLALPCITFLLSVPVSRSAVVIKKSVAKVRELKSHFAVGFLFKMYTD